jgi:hypothetical protein
MSTNYKAIVERGDAQPESLIFIMVNKGGSLSFHDVK